MNETFADCCLISLVVRPRVSVNDLGNVAEVSDRLAAAFNYYIQFYNYNQGGHVHARAARLMGGGACTCLHLLKTGEVSFPPFCGGFATCSHYMNIQNLSQFEKGNVVR